MKNYTIGVLADRTGLSTHTIRAWERRYSLLSPNRTLSNHRIYGESDLVRLTLLAQATGAGHSIGRISALSNTELAELGASPRNLALEDFLGQCEVAMMNLDAEAFRGCLRRSLAVLGIDGFVSDVVVPLLSKVDQGWENGGVRIAHEHFASSYLRTELEQIRFSIPPPIGAPRMLVTTPSGHVHELGALLVAVTAARHGWRVTYLGPNLPAAEISASSRQIRASVVALSLVYPEADLRTVGELKRLREQLGEGTPILLGGSGAMSYESVAAKINAVIVSDLPGVGNFLATIKP